MSVLHPLTDNELYNEAPTLFTEEPHYEVSDKYYFIPTIEVINEIKQYNWGIPSKHRKPMSEIMSEMWTKKVINDTLSGSDTLMTCSILHRIHYHQTQRWRS